MDKFINANQIIEQAAATIAELESQGRYGEAQKYHWFIGQIDATLAADVVSAEDYLALQNKCCDLANALNTTADTIAALEGEIEDLNEELCSADDSFDEIWNENQRLNRQVKDLQDDIAEQAVLLAEAEEDNATIEKRLEDAEDCLEKIQCDIIDKYWKKYSV